eukprot:2845081-Alexandrium_andersonii.AAC.1
MCIRDSARGASTTSRGKTKGLPSVCTWTRTLLGAYAPGVPRAEGCAFAARTPSSIGQRPRRPLR